jgi:hypothetical protein
MSKKVHALKGRHDVTPFQGVRIVGTLFPGLQPGLSPSAPSGLNAGVFLTCALLGLLLLVGCSPPEQRQALARREMVLAQLTEAAVRSVPKAGVLVIGNPFAHREGADPELLAVEEASVRGVERGIGDSGARFLGGIQPSLRDEALRDPTLVPIPPGATTPLSFLTEQGAWDRIRAAKPEANLWISLVGVPADLAETRAWLDADGPRLALFLPDLRLLGGREGVRLALESGRLVALVLGRPGAPPESEPMLANHREEFERRYLLVTRDTWASVVKAWPQLFP